MSGQRIVVVGGSGKVALRFTQLARTTYTISSLVRNESHFGAIQGAGGTPRLLSIEDATVGDLKSEFDGARGVLFAAGAGGKGGKDRTRKVDEEGAIKVFDAIEQLTGAKPYLVLVGALDTRDTSKSPPAHYTREDIEGSKRAHEAIGAYYDAKLAADQNLSRRTSFPWTILRPGHLLDEEPKGTVTAGKTGMGGVTRGDVASSILALFNLALSPSTTSDADKPKASGLAIDVVQGKGTDKPVEEAIGEAVERGESSLDSKAPETPWILHYNLRWLFGDLVAGITVGLVLVPQAMSYARIATLPLEYGLYSSFVGVMIYALFATSKDVTIGPVAVMSLEVARVISHVHSTSGGAQYSAPEIATALAFLCGLIVLGIGLLRIGWLIEFIPSPAISAFMTGSALNIAVGQLPSLMGYSSKLNTRSETYKVIINSLKHLPDTKLDAAFGLSGLAFLYIVRYVIQRTERRARNPSVKRIAFFALTLRTAFVIVILTVASWVFLRRKDPQDFPISVLKDVPSGFQHMGQPKLPTDLLSKIAPQLPVSTIILLLEHIAIAKSFGRVNNYKIDPNQELIAIGVSNLVGTVFNAYPATGSFSRSAIKAKAGVRTPLAGWFTGVCVVVALYALTSAFYWIPSAALSAVIIHAVLDLIASPKQVYAFWKVSPIEAVIFFIAVFVSVFATIEIGIYTSVGASVALLLFRIARPRGAFLGRVRIRPDVQLPPSRDEQEEGTSSGMLSPYPVLPGRDVYLPLLPDGVRNPLVQVEAPPPGVIVFRFEESFLYPNAAYYADMIVEYAHKHTRPNDQLDNVRAGDRPWNNPGALPWRRRKAASTPEEQAAADKPILRAVVFDMSSCSNIDTTSVQNLVDLKRTLERYAGDQVQFHFATILSPFIKRALLAGGFGTGKGWSGPERPLEIAPVVQAGMEPVMTEHAKRLQRLHFQRRFFPGSPMSGTPRKLADEKEDEGVREAREEREGVRHEDLEAALAEVGQQGMHLGGSVWGHQVPGHEEPNVEQPVLSTSFPRFHLDLTSAVSAAVGRDDW
ncbi:sulfate permease [Rhodotorula toruloides]|uniref:Sulfate permease n=1 Tax=Rhodotorula toruloides TaxID=5286 RepID=A0A511K9G8_RHOTO|nr:sulfate permease [Rhodotorula toruloides]